MTQNITAKSRKLFGRTMYARSQMLYFVYLPIATIGIVYIVLVLSSFNPSYKDSSHHEEVKQKTEEASGVQRIPQIQSAPAAPGSSGVR
jgi:hypothetical protein